MTVTYCTRTVSAVLLALAGSVSASEPLNVQPICERVARLESAGALHTAALTGETQRIAATEKGEGAIDRTTFRVDINNDGRADKVVMDDREYDSPTLQVMSDTNEPMKLSVHYERGDTVELREFVGYARQFRIIRDHDNTYLVIWPSRLFQAGKAMEQVFRFGVDNVGQNVCAFRVRGERIHRLREGTAPVCKQVLDKRVEFVKFDIPIRTSLYQDKTSDIPVVFGLQTALLDLDNDGIKDAVATTFREAEMSHSCNRHGLELLNSERTAPVDSPIQELLRQRLRICDDVSVSPFRFDGSTYIDLRPTDSSPWEEHEVLKIANGELQKTCGIDVLKQYDVLSEYQVRFGDIPPGGDRLAAALDQDSGLRLVELLYKKHKSFRAALKDPKVAEAMLETAFDEGRFDAVGWLLDHDVEILTERDADPAEFVDELVELAEKHPGETRVLMREISMRLKYVPEKFVDHGVEMDIVLLAELADLRLPVQFDRETQTGGSTGFMDRFGERKDGSEVSGETLRQLRRLERLSPPIIRPDAPAR